MPANNKTDHIVVPYDDIETWQGCVGPDSFHDIHGILFAIEHRVLVVNIGDNDRYIRGRRISDGFSVDQFGRLQ